MITTMDSAGRLVIPSDIRREAALEPGMPLEVRTRDGVIEIGERAYIGDDCIVSCATSVAIGAYVLLGHGVQIFDNDSHPLDPEARAEDWHAILTGGRRPPIDAAPVRIENHAWVGAGSFVLKGVTIGAGAVVGAGSVVTKDVPAGGVAMGNPARVMEQRDIQEERR